MKNLMFVDIDSDRNDTVIIAHPQIQGQPEMKLNPNKNEQFLDDIATLCEGVCTLLHHAEGHGIDEAELLRTCIRHLENGFVDSSYTVGIKKAKDLK